MRSHSWIENSLNALREQHLERSTAVFSSVGGKLTLNGRPYLNFSSNDYLDLARHPTVLNAAQGALTKYGTGSTASRLVCGTLDLHEELERRLAAHKGYPAALLFGSGYLANAGAITALAGPGTLVVTDKLAHASIIDAAILSRARLRRFQHNDPGHLEDILKESPPAIRKLVVTESVFSMDGDRAPLREIADLAQRYDALLMVDEAHASGVFGPCGSGLIHSLGLESMVAVSMCTLSKAFASYGGAIACSDTMRRWLVNKARAFIYTTALPPSVVGAALGALDALDQQPALGEELLRRATVFRNHLRHGGLNTLNSESQIIPVLVGDNAKSLALASRLRDKGLFAIAIRPPTVPRGTARLRFSVTLAHTPDDLSHAAGLILEAARAEGLV